VADGGDLSVSAQAALVGSYGMRAVLDDNVSIYVTDFSPFDETRYRGRFYFDPNTITMANNNAHYLLYALNRDDVVVARLELRRYNNTYQVRAGVVNDGSTWSNSAWFTITDAPHKLEIDWRASSGPGANNGGITFWVDDVQRGNFTTIDNDTRLVDYVQWGAVSGVDSGTRGTYYFDDFVSRRQSYIGMLDIPGRAVAQDGLPGAAKVLAAPPPVKLPSSPVDMPHGDTVYAPLAQGQAITTTTVITYTYDPLDRLIAADYSDGSYFHYEYDAVGNRLSEETNDGTTYYEYDEANRLIEVWGQGYAEYTWDDNGNLLDDSLYSYTYDHANRLVGVSGTGLSISYGYRCNGLSSDAWGILGCLSDRVSQTVNSATTNYVLDQAAGLTQVLTDGTNTYQYGIGRIAQFTETGPEYFLADGLGSVRQLVDDSGAVILTKNYQPFGEGLTGAGSGYTSYGFAGEMTDLTGLMYLRARYYASSQGRFISKDLWQGDDYLPMSFNAWLYVYANPTNRIDPSGQYAKATHHDLTLELAYQNGMKSCHGLVCALVHQISELIAAGNEHVDETILSADPRNPHPEIHFQDHPVAERNATSAISLNEPYLLGSALHQVQDWYTHWNEGYRYQWPNELGHGLDSIRAGCWLGKEECSRPWQLVALFYANHPFARAQLSQVYPEVYLNDVSADKLIDLYLETFTQPGDWDRGFLGYGFDTDYYFGFTARDSNMKSETSDWLALFFFQLDSCTAQNLVSGYSPPSDEAILDFLLTSDYRP
jgi:RHS repeat-associated protein